MSKPYCGIETKVPKGYHRATMQECIDNKQVRYYGLHKIDKKLLEAPKKKRISNKDREKQIGKLIIVKAKVKKLKEKIDDTDDVDEKAVLKDQLKALKKEGVEISDKLKETNTILDKPKVKATNIKSKKTATKPNSGKNQYKYDESTGSLMINNSELKPKIKQKDSVQIKRMKPMTKEDLRLLELNDEIAGLNSYGKYLDITQPENYKPSTPYKPPTPYKPLTPYKPSYKLPTPYKPPASSENLTTNELRKKIASWVQPKKEPEPQLDFVKRFLGMK